MMSCVPARGTLGLMQARVPIIGVAGGIGSGKSLVARLLAEEAGGVVHDADAVAKAQLDAPAVRDQVVDRFGSDLLNQSGRIDRKQLAERIFNDREARQWLEGLIHPRVAADRERFIERAVKEGANLIVLDVPLLFEAGVAERCDAVIFVEAEEDVRLQRLAASRGWDAAELHRREKNQWALDKKRDTSDHVLRNDRDEASCRTQVRQLLPRILRP